MTGDLWINDGENSYSMSSSGNNLWTISGFLSDDPEWGCSDPEAPCSGATGYWTLDQVSAPVPEPDLFAAFGDLALGLIGANTARRWRRDHPRQQAARFQRSSTGGIGFRPPAGVASWMKSARRPRSTRTKQSPLKAQADGSPGSHRRGRVRA